MLIDLLVVDTRKVCAFYLQLKPIESVIYNQDLDTLERPTTTTSRFCRTTIVYAMYSNSSSTVNKKVHKIIAACLYQPSCVRT